MTSRSSRMRRVVVPVGMAMATALAFLPATASATSADRGTAADTTAAPAAAGEKLSYVVNVKKGKGHLAPVKKAIVRAGGTIVMAYDQIGVIVVHATDPGFAAKIRDVKHVDSAGATRTAPIAAQGATGAGAAAQPLTAEQAAAAAAQAEAGQDPMEPLQWDLPAIKADKAHQKSLGSRDVTVAVIDTGVDDTHPDLAPNFDRAASVDCVGGKPNTADGAWRPYATGGSSHGTHVAGTIAAAKNGTGVTGVAPGVKVAGIKVSTQNDGMFYTEAVVCGFVWAAEHGADITNNSYYVDPWMFNCTTDPDQKALVEAVSRATRYAERKGAVNVAAAGNSAFDLAADTILDKSSPNDTVPGPREIDPSVCLDLPRQVDGVLTVSSTGAKGLKSSFSNYGLGVIDIAAPGGDATRFQKPDAPAVDGRILSTVPGGGYGYAAGTSMASPHVAGVAALIKSTHPNASPQQVKRLLLGQADPMACPTSYDLDGDGKTDAVCQADADGTNFYGAGMADALDAVEK
ncbi:S8 family serine peptidase [Streptomyces pactum]|uniref:S8 family serine peptidase n=1 Tax=Streptomyces pactum TaxID=68249 RepID=A0ABS0NTZ1_9ACTN|nr:S8 family serine peptidase [Streptomyces pactum]MBH5338682.1 S8 family serine peptidase [Streptomyces pactum]